MRKFIVKRLGYSLISLFLLSLTIFLLMRITGDPAVLLAEPGASAARPRRDPQAVRPGPAAVDPVRAASSRTWPAATSASRSTTARTSSSSISRDCPLADAGRRGDVVLAPHRYSHGIVAAVRVNEWWDSAGKIFALLGLSMPSFWLGLLMILFFSVYLGWLPSSGSGRCSTSCMPAFALGGVFVAAHMRLTRSSMLEVLGSEYVKLARLKGLARSARDLQARLQERADPGDHARRDQPRHHGQHRPSSWRRCSPGPASAACSTRASASATSRWCRRRRARRHHDHRRQPRRGYPLRRHRPEDQI